MRISRSAFWFVLGAAASGSAGLAACVGDSPSGNAAATDAGGASSSSSGGSSSSSSGSSSSSSSSSSGGSSGSSDAGPDADAPILTGTPDPTFQGGFKSFAIDDAGFRLRDVALDAQGGLVVAGTANDDGACAGGAIGVMRLTAAGTPRVAFGGVGATCWRSGNLGEGAAITALPGGDVVAVGTGADEDYANPVAGERGAGWLNLVRLSSTATVVATVALDSPAGYVVGSHYRPRAIAANDTEVIVAGMIRDPLQVAAAARGFVAKYTYNVDAYTRTWGQADSGVRYFSGVGFAFDGSTLVGGVQPSDGGTNQDRFFVRSYSSNGTAGPTLLSQFERPVGRASYASTLLDPAGNPVLLAATNADPASGVGNGAVLTRFSQGAVDGSFGLSGIARITGLQFDAQRSPGAAARDAVGRYLVLAPAADGVPVLHRLTPAGSPDATFGTNGKLRLSLPTTSAADAAVPTFANGLRTEGFVVSDAQSRITVVFPSDDGFYVQRLLP